MPNREPLGWVWDTKHMATKATQGQVGMGVVLPEKVLDQVPFGRVRYETLATLEIAHGTQ
jgi:hypothetical protein